MSITSFYRTQENKQMERNKKEKEKEKAKSKNRGEKDELICKTIIYNLNETKQYSRLVEYFGEDACQGVILLNMESNKPITNMNDLKKAGSSYKADVSFKMVKTRKIHNSSIKATNGAHPSIINPTRRSMMMDNPNLNRYIGSLDHLAKQYLADPANVNSTKSEVDRKLSNYHLNDKQKKDILSTIAYFTFRGTGTGLSKMGANSIIEYSNKNLKFAICETHQQQLEYVEKNWDRYIMSFRGHTKQKNGKIRCNGLKSSGLSENDVPWACFYEVNGERYPRGALTIRIK
jgi:hypothetical protein